MMCWNFWLLDGNVCNSSWQHWHTGALDENASNILYSEFFYMICFIMYVRFVCLAAFSSSCCGVTRVGAMEKILTYFETATPSAIFHYCSVCVLFTVKQCSSTTFDIWDSSKNQYKVTANQNFGSHINELYPGKEKVIEVWPRIKCFANIPNQPSPFAALQVLEKVIISRFDPHGKDKLSISLVPTETLKDFWLPITAFDVSVNAKNGCRGGKNTLCFNT